MEDFENDINKDLGEYVDLDTDEIINEEDFVEYTESDIIDSLDDDDDGGFGPVLSLTQFETGVDNFNGSGNLAMENSGYGIAEYDSVNVDNIIIKQSKLAEKFVKDINSFVTKLGDVQLNNKHKVYMETAASLKVASLIDLMTMRDINMSMLKNIVSLMNSTNGEDVMILQNYNSLVTTHMKLIKELDGFIKQLPQDLKKLRNDVLSPEQLEKSEGLDVNVEIVGKNTHNNTMALLKQIEQEEAKNSQNN